jgi:hypothetical protein
MRLVAVAAVAATVAVGCGAAGDGIEDGARGGAVYEIHLEMEAPVECEAEPSCVLVRHVTWVAPDTGSWRSESEDGSGFTTTRVSAHGMYLVAHSPPPSRELRIGSPARLGSLTELPPGYESLLAKPDLAVGDSIEGDRDGVSYTLIVADLIPLAEAGRRGLFAISTQEPGTEVSRELAPGEPTKLGVAAYWFGPEVAGRKAFTALDHDGEDVLHITFYGDPAEIAAGKTHAYAGRDAPERELQVASRALDHPSAQRDLRVYDGVNGDLISPPLPRTRIRLQNGEEATLFPRTGDEGGFAVVTQTTLISVAGASGAEARRIAPLLRPLGAQPAEL